MTMTRSKESNKPTTLDARLKAYLEYLQNVRRLSANTLAAYEHDIGDFLAWYQDNGQASPLAEVGEADVVSYLGQLEELAANTICRRAHALSGWFKFLVRQDAVDSNPVENVQLPRRQRTVPNVPTKKEVQLLVLSIYLQCSKPETEAGSAGTSSIG